MRQGMLRSASLLILFDRLSKAIHQFDWHVHINQPKQNLEKGKPKRENSSKPFIVVFTDVRAMQPTK